MLTFCAVKDCFTNLLWDLNTFQKTLRILKRFLAFGICCFPLPYSYKSTSAVWKFWCLSNRMLVALRRLLNRLRSFWCMHFWRLSAVGYLLFGNPRYSKWFQCVPFHRLWFHNNSIVLYPTFEIKICNCLSFWFLMFHYFFLLFFHVRSLKTNVVWDTDVTKTQF